MQNICNNCNHWEPQAPVVAQKENFGECNKLSHLDSVKEPEFIIPVLNNGKLKQNDSKSVEFITGANFGCNQFATA